MAAKRLAEPKAAGRPFTAIKLPRNGELDCSHLYKWLLESGIVPEEIPLVIQALGRALLKAAAI